MKWRNARRSNNVDDRRGLRTGGGVKLGLGGIVAVVVVGLLFGQNPPEILGLVAEVQQGAPQPGASAPPVGDEASDFVSPTRKATSPIRARAAGLVTGPICRKPNTTCATHSIV